MEIIVRGELKLMIINATHPLSMHFQEYYVIREYLVPAWLLFVQACITIAFILAFTTLIILALELVRWPLKIVLQYEWLMTKVSCICLTISSKCDIFFSSSFSASCSFIIFFGGGGGKVCDQFQFILMQNQINRCVDVLWHRHFRFQCISSRLADVSKIQYHLVVICVGRHCCGIIGRSGRIITT